MRGAMNKSETKVQRLVFPTHVGVYLTGQGYCGTTLRFPRIHGMSAGMVSRLNGKVYGKIEGWRKRP